MKKYLVFLFSPVFVTLVLLLLGWVFLWRAGEYRPMEEVVTRQLESGGLYSSGLAETTYAYKHALYARVKPVVAAVGSSRVMQFRSDSFSVPFVTLGGAAGGLSELEKTIDQMLSSHRPRLMLMGLDFWWFAEGYVEPAENPVESRVRFIDRVDVHPADLAEPYVWMIKGRLSPSVFVRILWRGTENQGVPAATKGDGYDASGTYYYMSLTATAAAKPFDWDRPRMEQGRRIYVFGEEISESRWEIFERIVSKLEAAGVEFILFLPPMSPEGYSYLKASGKHAYIEKLRARLGAFRYPVYDYHDPAVIGGDPCEFIDTHHAGAVFYNRILLDLALRKNSPLASFVDNRRLFERIKQRQGYATYAPSWVETDFLGIGCRK